MSVGRCIGWSLCVGHCGSVAFCRLLWVVCYGPVAVFVVDRSLCVGCCDLVAVGQLMWVNCYVGWLLCVWFCGSVVVLVGCCESVGRRDTLFYSRRVQALYQKALSILFPFMRPYPP